MNVITRENLPSSVFNKTNNKGSLRYRQVGTIDIVDQLAQRGWVPVSAEQTKVRVKGNEMAKHMLRLQHVDSLSDGKDALQMILVNSHDCTAAFRFYLGIFRFVCSNGLVAGECFDRVSIRHVGFALDKIEKTIDNVLEIAPNLHTEVDRMQAKQLSDTQVLELAREAYKLKYNDDDNLLSPERLLTVRRQEDQSQDAWTVFNRVQETLIRGTGKVLVEKDVKSQYDDSTYKIQGYKKIRSVNNIDKKIKLNRQLWDLFKNAA